MNQGPLDRLTASRAQSIAALTALHRDLDGVINASESSNADDEHDPEGATIAFERAQLSALLGQAQDRLADTDRALTRLRDGSYGICERCGERISPERLAARPSARTCIGCARLTGR